MNAANLSFVLITTLQTTLNYFWKLSLSFIHIYCFTFKKIFYVLVFVIDTQKYNMLWYAMLCMVQYSERALL